MSSDNGFSGQRLRRIREGKKLTRAAVARNAGVDSVEIEQIESGEIDPTLGQLGRIAAAMEVSLADLLFLPPAPIECTVHLAKGEGPAHQAASGLIPVPIVSGEIAAGNARIVEDAILGWLFLPKEEFGRRSANLVAVQVYGRSMEPEIPDGCVAVVDRNDRVTMPEGIYAIRDLDGGCTVKRIEILDADHVALIPSNRSEFKVDFLKLEPGESVGDRIIGRVIWVGRSFISGTKAAENAPPYGLPDVGLAKDLPPSPPKGPEKSF